MHVVVVGGGWAGIAAAVELASRGVGVTLVEAAPQLGGRARRVSWGRLSVDNGQHILIGAYQHTLRLLSTVGVDESEAFLRLPLQLELVRPDGSRVKLRAPLLPAPFHLVGALLGCAGLSVTERLSAFKLCAHLVSARFTVSRDSSVADWLARHRQPKRVAEALWTPLCLATLNTPPNKASTRLFLRVLRRSFMHRRSDSDFLLPRKDLSTLLPEPGGTYIEAQGGQVQLRRRVTGLHIKANRITGVDTQTGSINADKTVLATPPIASARLLAPHTGLAPLATALEALDHEPICTVYLRYPETVDPGPPMLGLTGRVAQWIFDRQLTGQPGVMSVVISASGSHLSLDNTALLERVGLELAEVFPLWPHWESGWVVREKQATIACTVDVESRRPAHRTPVRDLWLAGDFTATGLPATLEGAVASGIQCVRSLMADRESE